MYQLIIQKSLLINIIKKEFKLILVNLNVTNCFYNENEIIIIEL